MSRFDASVTDSKSLTQNKIRYLKTYGSGKVLWNVIKENIV